VVGVGWLLGSRVGGCLDADVSRGERSLAVLVGSADGAGLPAVRWVGWGDEYEHERDV